MMMGSSVNELEEILCFVVHEAKSLQTPQKVCMFFPLSPQLSPLMAALLQRSHSLFNSHMLFPWLCLSALAPAQGLA